MEKEDIKDLDDIDNADNNSKINSGEFVSSDKGASFADINISKDSNSRDAQSNKQTDTSNESQDTNSKEMPESDSKFFAIRITGGQENVIANILQNKITSKKINLRSILILDNFKGYVIVEAPDSNIAYDALYGVRHVRGQIRGDLPFTDIEKYLIKKPVVTDLAVDDIVEVIAGPFKSMKAKITHVDYEKKEATVVLLDSPYQIPVTVDANYLKKAGA